MKKKAGGLRAVITLFLITALMAGLLGLVNSVTEDRIREATNEKTQAALSAVLAPGVTLGEPVEDFQDDTGLVKSAYRTSDGFVFTVAPSGYGGEITMTVGVASDLTVTGVQIVTHSETSGLGANAAAASAKGESFRGQFEGLSGTLAVTKDGGTIEALTGATVTSRAVTAGVNAATACAAKMEGGVQ